jgi:hypothetical protein
MQQGEAAVLVLPPTAQKVTTYFNNIFFFLLETSPKKKKTTAEMKRLILAFMGRTNQRNIFNALPRWGLMMLGQSQSDINAISEVTRYESISSNGMTSRHSSVHMRQRTNETGHDERTYYMARGLETLSFPDFEHTAVGGEPPDESAT